MTHSTHKQPHKFFHHCPPVSPHPPVPAPCFPRQSLAATCEGGEKRMVLVRTGPPRPCLPAEVQDRVRGEEVWVWAKWSRCWPAPQASRPWTPFVQSCWSGTGSEQRYVTRNWAHSEPLAPSDPGVLRSAQCYSSVVPPSCAVSLSPSWTVSGSNSLWPGVDPQHPPALDHRPTPYLLLSGPLGRMPIGVCGQRTGWEWEGH